MADVYIDDSGAYERDALFIGVEDTAWSKNATDRAIWFSSTGTCETGFTLPDSEWIVYEVYGMTGTSLTADYTTLTGSTKLHGKKEYTTTIGTVLTTLNAWRTALDKTNYTTYDIIATHYKGSDLADVYEADETVAFTTATTTGGTYTGHGSEWVVSDALLADSVVTSVSTYINLYNDTLGTAPSGMTINNFALSTRATTTARALVNENNVDDGMTFRNTVSSRSDQYEDGAQSGDDSFHFPDCIMKDYWRWTLGVDRLIELFLPEGTYNIYTPASGFAWSNTATTDFDIDGGTIQTLYMNPTSETVRETFDDIEPDLATFSSVVVGAGGATVDLNFQANGATVYLFVTGIQIEKVA